MDLVIPTDLLGEALAGILFFTVCVQLKPLETIVNTSRCSVIFETSQNCDRNDCQAP